MGEVVQLSKPHRIDPAYKGAFGICCSFQEVGAYALAEVQCRFTGELPARIRVYVCDPSGVVIKKVKDRSKEHGEIVFLVAADPPLKYVHLHRTLLQDGTEDIMCLLTEDLPIRLNGNLHCIVEWEGKVETPWTLFTID